jgi:hypothetical protein
MHGLHNYTLFLFLLFFNKFFAERVNEELKTKTDNMKEEVTHDMKNLRKKNKIEIQNTM